jgi:hypothetical protein
MAAAWVLLGGRFCVRPAWALTWRWKSSEDLVTGTQGNRKGVTARERPKEAGNEPTG